MQEFARYHQQFEHAPDSLREHGPHAATETAQSGRDHDDLPALVWAELKRGECVVVDSFVSDDRCYAVTVPTGPAHTTPVPGSHQMLEDALLGASQKQLCIDAERAVSTIGLSMRSSLQLMGVSVTPSRVPLLLVIMARASARAARVIGTRCSECLQDGVKYRLISLPRPEARVARRLSTAEYAVARYLVEGKTHQEIAALRRTAIRTVANQIGSMFKKLAVSGRCEMLWLLADLALLPEK